MNGSVLDGKLAFGTGDLVPSAERLSVEQGRLSQGLQKHVSKFDLAPIHLQADVASLQGLIGRIGIFQNLLTIELNSDVWTLQANVKCMPVSVAQDRLCGFAPSDQTCGGELRFRIAQIQFIAVDGRS